MKSTQNQPPVNSAKDDVGWRHFPEFEKLLSGEEPPPLMARVEKTCRQLDSIIKNGSETDRQRAQMAMTAFGRSLDLLRTLTDMRNKTLLQK